MANRPKTHEVVDIKTNQVISKHVDVHRALRAADRLDLQYGAVRYIVRRIAK